MQITIVRCETNEVLDVVIVNRFTEEGTCFIPIKNQCFMEVKMVNDCVYLDVDDYQFYIMDIF